MADPLGKLEQNKLMLLHMIDIFTPFCGHSFLAIAVMYDIVTDDEKIQFPGVLSMWYL